VSLTLGKRLPPSKGGKGRGRKSYLLKAQNKYLVDIAVAKKIFIFGELRASHAPGGVP